MGNDIYIYFGLIFSLADHCFLQLYYCFCLLQDDVNEKISSAFCPPRVAVYNPCLEYIKSVAFPWFGNLEVVQKEGNGSNK